MLKVNQQDIFNLASRKRKENFLEILPSFPNIPSCRSPILSKFRFINSLDIFLEGSGSTFFHILCEDVNKNGINN